MLYIGRTPCFGLGHAAATYVIASLAFQNSITDWNNIKALLANHLIALDKCPGVRPIGVGETLHRIISKTICLLT